MLEIIEFSEPLCFGVFVAKKIGKQPPRLKVTKIHKVESKIT
jgi:hypothetical protein